MRKDGTIAKVCISFCGLIFAATSATAAEYECSTNKMIATGEILDAKKVEQGQFSVKIVESPELSSLSRCSFVASVGKVTCDTYLVDKIVFDKNVRVKKFYNFRTQFDVQLFSDLSFIENNGRGGLAFGSCKVTSP